MSGAIPWDFLERELKNNNIYGAELAKMIHSPERVIPIDYFYVEKVI